ncbi:acyltransferase [Pantoea sp. EKM21T]|uniref:acyltransferase family protein n=1 Tax=unclassified Pantoea TaxID=2630326 RepID=UPI00142D1E34|nr:MULTISPECIES: acyltransferase [unclassified Pantoea]KAF6677010.1 acyltransferase [Pantoea sp. EKM21T]KAF6677227.1 acyltransferase [Pantoea sp. EKM22T]
MKQRLLELDGCRGLLCWTVVAGHWIGSRMGWGNVNFSHSYISVDGFFILSGIVLSYIYKEKLLSSSREFFKYSLHRLERLYPLHILTFVITYLIYSKFFDSFPFENPGLTALYNMLLIHGLGFASSWNWNDPSWSISVELYASILAFPLLIRIKNNFTLIVIAVICYILVYARHHNLEAATDVHLFLFSSGILKCIAGISLGVLISNLSNYTSSKNNAGFLTTVFQTVAVAMSGFFIYSKDTIHAYDGLVIVSFCYIFFTLINYSSFWNTLASNKAMVYFGNISFSIYLLHTPLMLLLDQANFFRKSNTAIQTLIFITVLISISHFVYNRFELPIYKRLKKTSDNSINKHHSPNVL